MGKLELPENKYFMQGVIFVGPGASNIHLWVKGRIEAWDCKGNYGFDLYSIIHPILRHLYQVLEILYHVKLSHELEL